LGSKNSQGFGMIEKYIPRRLEWSRLAPLNQRKRI
jgi:hypothetical protein